MPQVRWTNTEYESLLEIGTSGHHLYSSDFVGEWEFLSEFLLPHSGLRLSDEDRKELLSYWLAQIGYYRPIRTWQAGLRIFVGWYNRSFFAEYYLGLKHYEHQAKWRQNFGRRRHLQLAPRSHGKSRIYSFELPVRSICYHDNVRLLHVTNVGNEAQKYLLSIRGQFETNDRICEDFGDLAKGIDEQGLEFKLSSTWSKDMFYVRRSNTSLKDPTMQAIGAGQAITGARFDGVIADDIIEKEDCDTIKKRDEFEAWWNAVILELLDTHGWALMIGTRKHGDDIYERTEKNPIWTYGIDKAIIKYPTHYEYVMKNDENGIRNSLRSSTQAMDRS